MLHQIHQLLKQKKCITVIMAYLCCMCLFCAPPPPPPSKLGAVLCIYPHQDPTNTRPHMHYVPTCIAHQKRMWVHQLDSMNSIQWTVWAVCIYIVLPDSEWVSESRPCILCLFIPTMFLRVCEVFVAWPSFTESSHSKTATSWKALY